MRIAVVGAGVSGLVCAHVLSNEHLVTVFEAASYLGGHTNTVEVDLDGDQQRVDTGFIVFNDHYYPNFRKLIDRLGVRWVLAIRGTPEFDRASGMPHLRPADSSDWFTAVFEYARASPQWRWTAGTVQLREWQGKVRVFSVESQSGGTFQLKEQWYPGWSARIDGVAGQLGQTKDGFQEVTVAGGRHELRFEYRAQGLRTGALVSALGWMLLLIVAKRG